MRCGERDTDFIFSIVYVDLNRYDEAQVALISTIEGSIFVFIFFLLHMAFVVMDRIVVYEGKFKQIILTI